jgi:hypothetical protein
MPFACSCPPSPAQTTPPSPPPPKPQPLLSFLLPSSFLPPPPPVAPPRAASNFTPGLILPALACSLGPRSVAAFSSGAPHADSMSNCNTLLPRTAAAHLALHVRPDAICVASRLQRRRAPSSAACSLNSLIQLLRFQRGCPMCSLCALSARGVAFAQGKLQHGRLHRMMRTLHPRVLHSRTRPAASARSRVLR